MTAAAGARRAVSKFRSFNLRPEYFITTQFDTTVRPTCNGKSLTLEILEAAK